MADAAATAADAAPQAPPALAMGDMQAAAPRPPVNGGMVQARKIGATLAGFMVQPGGFQVAAVSMGQF